MKRQIALECRLHALTNKFAFVRISTMMCGVLWASGSYANTGQADAVFGLFLNPKSCVVKDRQKFCDQKVEVFWSLKEPLSVCLFTDPKTEQDLAACSNDLINHATTVLLNTRRDVAFELRDNSSGHVLYSELFKVYTSVTTRRKRRNPWSFY